MRKPSTVAFDFASPPIAKGIETAPPTTLTTDRRGLPSSNESSSLTVFAYPGMHVCWLSQVQLKST